MYKPRSSEGEARRLASLPSGEKHWNWTPKPSLLALHKRIYRKHGPASNHPCIDCGQKAKDWSNTGKYTDRIEDYVPRCRSCHIKHDFTDERRKKVSAIMTKRHAANRKLNH